MKKILFSAALILAIVMSNQAQSILKFEFTTGSDNLESRSKLKGTLYLHNLPNVDLPNICSNRELREGSFYEYEFGLPAGITVDNLKGFYLYTEGNLGYNNTLFNDNWSLNKIKITLTETSNNTKTSYKLYEKYGRPLCRFKGFTIEGISQYMFTEKVKISEESLLTKANLKITFSTGRDDLRGGNDNVNVLVHFRNIDQPVIFNNINVRRAINSGNERAYIKELPPNYNVNDITKVTLEHTGGGGISADNWDLNRFRVESIIQDKASIILDKSGSPLLHRFTGDNRSRTFSRF
ncbi:MAG: hypothetical protein ACOYOA_14120 [Saprospiraceae bacterium]